MVSSPEQMVEAYRKRFKALAPFTEDALFTLARMSRGIFRRFLRYITLALQLQEVDTITSQHSALRSASGTDKSLVRRPTTQVVKIIDVMF